MMLEPIPILDKPHIDILAAYDTVKFIRIFFVKCVEEKEKE
jgi:hypothetical protein